MKTGAIAGVSFAFPWMGARNAHAFATSDGLRKFIQPLRGVGGSGIPVAQKDGTRQSWWQPNVDHYTMDIGQFEDQLHPDLPNPTRLWGYGQGYASNRASWTRHLGGIILARRGTPTQITFRNQLPDRHLLPVDRTLPGAEGVVNRTAVHLHGGFTPWISDGGPNAWWDPRGNRGPSQVNVPGSRPKANEAEYYYPNQQSARLMIYHDHAMGTTRLNVQAGLISGYVVTDDYEDALVKTGNLPGPTDPRTVYLFFQDRVFLSNATLAADAQWPVSGSRAGDLWYPHVYEAERWEVSGGTPPHPSVVPEFFGDTMLVNGLAYPYLEVEPRQYRLRLANACNARFLNPRLLYARGAAAPDSSEPDATRPGPAFVQIGNEGGFLPAPAMVNGPKQARLLLAPAERADLIVDFRDVPPGSVLLLCNDAPGPYPGGGPEYDIDPTVPGYGPDTHTLLQIRVRPLSGGANASVSLPVAFTPTDPFLVEQKPGVPTRAPAGVPTRYLTLNEGFDQYGRLIQYLGTNQPVNNDPKNPVYGRAYMDAPTEVVKAGTMEIWEIANLTMDTHPIHFHLVNVQLLSRQAFSNDSVSRGRNMRIAGMPMSSYVSPPVAPDDNELGWKETVRMNPGQVTRVLMRFDLPVVPFTVPLSGTTGVIGHEYVWHCHILEHEEHDMMRPLIVIG
jgi:spore coat protein A